MLSPLRLALALGHVDGTCVLLLLAVVISPLRSALLCSAALPNPNANKLVTQNVNKRTSKYHVLVHDIALVPYSSSSRAMSSTASILLYSTLRRRLVEECALRVVRAPAFEST